MLEVTTINEESNRNEILKVRLDEYIQDALLNLKVETLAKALVEFCESEAVEFDELPRLMSVRLLSDLEMEGVDMGFLKPACRPSIRFG